jgi:CRP/FNR family transcriptional regulator
MTPELAALAERVSHSVLDLAERIGRPVELAPAARLFSAGDDVAGVHLVLTGTLRIVREGEGRAVVVHREGPGGLLGEVALFGGGVYPATAIAVERTRVLLLPTRDVLAEMRTNGELAELFLRRLAGRTREVIARLDRLAHQSVLRRLAGHLVARRLSASGARDGPVSLGMTQTELAEELGTVKEVIVRELRTLRRLQLIEPAGRGLYRIADLAALRAVAGHGRHRAGGNLDSVR